MRRRGIKGSLTVFMSLVMAAIFAFTAVMIDASKILLARNLVSGAGDMALNAALTNYNSVLEDTYGIFAISRNMDELESNLEAYFETTLHSSGLNKAGAASELVKLALGNGSTDDIAQVFGLNMDESTFVAEGVDGATLANTAVLRAEVLEYMKYRGPAVIGYGFLEKLNLLKGLPQQQKALEKKLEYEKKLSDIGSLLEKLYNSSKEYQDFLDTEPFVTRKDMEGAIAGAKLSFFGATGEAIAHARISEYPLLKSQEEWNTAAKNNETGNRTLETSQTELGEGDSLSGSFQALGEAYKKQEGLTGASGVDNALAYFKQYEKDVHLFREIHNQYSNAKKPDSNEDGEVEDDGEDQEEEEAEDVEELTEELDTWYKESLKKKIGPKYEMKNVRTAYLNNLKSNISIAYQFGVKGLESPYQWANTLTQKAKKVQDDISALEKELDKLDKIGVDWKNAINGMDSSSIKEEMDGDRSSKTTQLNRNNIKQMKSIIGEGELYGKRLKEALGAVEFANHKPAVNPKNDSDALIKKAKKAVGSVEDIQTDTDLENKTGTAMNSLYKENNANVISKIKEKEQAAGNDMKSEISMLRQGKKIPFYAYLERNHKIGAVDENKKKDAESSRDERFKDFENQKKSNASVKAPKVSGELKTVAWIDSSASSNTQDAGDIGDFSSDNAAKNASSTSKNAINGFEKIGQILESGRDKIYLTSYQTTMFSCYTTNVVPKEANPPEETTLANISLNAVNNAWFRAEQEYILCGKTDADANLNDVKARLFGIRLLLNMLYGFTGNQELRTSSLTAASAMVGWSGILVPIVQSVIIIAVCVLESMWDVNELLQGKSVPLFKTPETWQFSLKGGLNKGKDILLDTLYIEMNKATDKMTTKLEESLKSGVDNTISGGVDSVISAIQLPIQNAMTRSLAQIMEEGDAAKKEAKGMIDSTFDEIKQSIDKDVQNGGLIAKAKQKAFQQFDTPQTRESMYQFVEKGISSEQSSLAGLESEIETFFSQTSVELKEAAKSVLKTDTLQKELNDNVRSAFEKGNKNTQALINDKVNAFTKKMEGSFSKSSGSSSNTSESSGFNKSSAGMIPMTYKDYMLLFLLIENAVNEEACVQRMGNLMQMNTQKKDSLYFVGDSFEFSKAYTGIQISVKASIKPTYLNLEWVNGGRKEFMKDRYDIGYKGVLVY